jgi:hypothetical protein
MNTVTVPEPRTAAALAARRRKTEAALERVHQAIARLRREKAQVSVAAVARRADVSRTFLYNNVEARAAVAAATAQAGERRSRTLAEQDDEREATGRERALNAEDALKAAHSEILAQRTQIGELPGQIRDLEAEWTEGAIQRITTENTTLKQRAASSPPTTAPSTSGSRPPARTGTEVLIPPAQPLQVHRQRVPGHLDLRRGRVGEPCPPAALSCGP